jgi:hypothetical protein
MSSRFSTRAMMAGVLACAFATGLTACKPGPNGTDTTAAAPAALDAQLSDPRVDDLWATEISHFSAGEFGEGQDAENPAYGLLKVIEVQGDQLVLITETGAWPKKRGAINDLRSDLSTISWDENEKIVVKRSELPGLVASGMILETRRLAAQAQ